MNAREERDIKFLFDIGLTLKAMSGTLEIIAAIAIGFVPRMLVVKIADIVTAGELAEDPTDLVSHLIRTFAHEYALHAHYLLAFFIALDGAAKVALVALVFKGYSFAYPLFIVVLGILGSYEAYRAVTTSNILLGALALFDIVLILLTAYESRRRYSSRV